MITHGDPKKEWAQVWEGSGKECRACDEKKEEGILAKGAWWEGRQGEEQEAGDCDWAFRGAQERRESPVEAEVEPRAQEDGWPQEDRGSKEAGIEAEVDGQLQDRPSERKSAKRCQ
jgi:hypothetical protein